VINFTRVCLFFGRIRKFLQHIWWNRIYLKTNYPDHSIVKEFSIGRRICWQLGKKIVATGVVIGYHGIDIGSDVYLLKIKTLSPKPYIGMTYFVPTEEVLC
jgi:hypothetical protein